MKKSACPPSSHGIVYALPLMLVFFAQIFLASAGYGEVTLDGSLGKSGALSGPNYSITSALGRQVGSNLFHSFGKFNINNGESATFSGPSGTISNVIGRVTGGTGSTINGGLSCTIYGANLYLLNPNGVVFGPNAGLNISGSFHVSTADYLRLEDGGRFDATHPENSVLTTAPPCAFGFLDEKAPVDISMNGTQLRVSSGKSISVVGGNLHINSSLLSPRADGRINLAAVGSGGEVVFSESDLDTTSFEHMAEIDLTGGTNVWGGSMGGGSIFVRGGRFVMDRSNVLAATTGSKDGGIIDISLRDDMLVTNGAILSGATAANSTGRGSDIRLSARSLELSNNGQINNNSSGSGAAGDIQINVSDLAMSTGGSIKANGSGGGRGGNISIDANGGSVLISGNGSKIESSNGGGINITADNMQVTDLAEISANTSGMRNGGDILLEVGNLNVNNATISCSNAGSGLGGNLWVEAKGSVSLSGIRACLGTVTSGSGNAGNLFIDVGNLSLTDGAMILSGTTGNGNSGGLNITAADTVWLSGHPTGLFATSFGNGNAGDIHLTTGKLIMTDGAQINADSWGDRHGNGTGNAGRIDITAGDSVFISGFHIDSAGEYHFSSIASTTHTAGNAGDILLKTRNLTLLDAAEINASSFSNGKGGFISITASDSVLFSGYTIDNYGNIVCSGLLNVTLGDNDGGDIFLNAGNLTMTNLAHIDTFSRGKGNSGDISIIANSVFISGPILNIQGGRYTSGIYSSGEREGNAGNILMDIGTLTLKDGAEIASDSRGSGKGGNIDIFAADSISLGNGSCISTATEGVGDAGNMTIKTGALTLTEGAMIDAGTFGGGKGGNIDITARNGISLTSSSLKSESRGEGKAGDITLNVGSLTLSGGGEVSTSSDYGGNSGLLTVNASDSVYISGLSGIYSLANGSGNAGDIIMDVGTLSLTDGGIISAATFGSGTGGTMHINARNSLFISGYGITNIGATRLSGLTSRSNSNGNAGHIFVDTYALNMNGGRINTDTASTGRGGDIQIKADHLDLYGGATISAQSTGTGDAGSIGIDASDYIRMKGSSVTTAAETADGGNIALSALNRIHLTDSKVTATVGGGMGSGGNISLTSRDLILDGSDIIADAYMGSGGNIDIFTKAFLRSADSNVSASSALGVQGSVLISSPFLDVAGTLFTPPNSFLNAEEFLARRCATRSREKTSSFVITGRGGLPAAPAFLLSEK